MLKETALSITPAVTQLFNVSIQLWEIPEEWKSARVTPIPKSRDHPTPENYPPISLLSVLSKLLEMHIRNLLVVHLEEYWFISGDLLKGSDNWCNCQTQCSFKDCITSHTYYIPNT